MTDHAGHRIKQGLFPTWDEIRRSVWGDPNDELREKETRQDLSLPDLLGRPTRVGDLVVATVERHQGFNTKREMDVCKVVAYHQKSAIDHRYADELMVVSHDWAYGNPRSEEFFRVDMDVDEVKVLLVMKGAFQTLENH